MKKIFPVILVTIILWSVLASCSKEQTNDEQSVNTSETVIENTETQSTETQSNEEPTLKKYYIDSSEEYVSVSSDGIEFCATYEGMAYIKMTVIGNRSVNYNVYVNGKKTGSMVATGSTSPKKIPGSADNAGSKVLITITRAEDNPEIDVVFHEIQIRGALEKLVNDSTRELMSYDIILNKDKIHIQGRSMDTLYEASFDWSASGIEFNATYTGYVYVSGKGPSNNVRFRVYVNGKETGVVSFGSTYELKMLPGTYSVEETTAHIRLVRLEYVKDGLATLKTVKLAGEIHDWQKGRKFIEFIGDSITCGFGSVTKDSTKDGSRTFAYLTACEFDVDYSMVAISGIGVSASTSQHSGKNMVDFYKYTNYYRNTTELYVPERKADLVVVNLNTNDISIGVVEEKYKSDAKMLISDIRAIHGEEVEIIWIIGQMSSAGSAANGWLADVFEELGGEAEGYYIIKTTQNNAGGDGHPNYDSHKVTAGHLIEFIEDKELLG